MYYRYANEIEVFTSLSSQENRDKINHVTYQGEMQQKKPRYAIQVRV